MYITRPTDWSLKGLLSLSSLSIRTGKRSSWWLRHCERPGPNDVHWELVLQRKVSPEEVEGEEPPPTPRYARLLANEIMSRSLLYSATIIVLLRSISNFMQTTKRVQSPSLSFSLSLSLYPWFPILRMVSSHLAMTSDWQLTYRESNYQQRLLKQKQLWLFFHSKCCWHFLTLESSEFVISNESNMQQSLLSESHRDFLASGRPDDQHQRLLGLVEAANRGSLVGLPPLHPHPHLSHLQHHHQVQN